MPNEIINSIFFGLGIFIQAFLLVGFKRGDLKEMIKDIGRGFLFVFIVLSAIAESGQKIDFGTFYLLIYIFYIGFIVAFTLSFKKKILLKINEISLFALNIIFLYYCITRLGFDDYFTKIIYLPTIIVLMLILFKSKLKNFYKGLLYLWYVALFLIISLINIYQISGDGGNIYLSYLSSFFKGGIFLYIWIYFVCLIMFTKIIDFFLSKNRYDVRSGRAELKEHFSDLANSFNKTKINNLKILTLFVILFGFLTMNYYNNYISESLLIVFILFIASVSSAKRVDLTKRDVARKIN
ncbi:hypothetical protein KAT63_00105 [Candidatus Parcubacteria bacterium]|nr:hypothetical protein [Candidatus Parcubacteria bacterium]